MDKEVMKEKVRSAIRYILDRYVYENEGMTGAIFINPSSNQLISHIHSKTRLYFIHSFETIFQRKLHEALNRR